MNRQPFCARLLPLMALGCSGLLGGGRVAAEDGCVAAACHAKLIEAKVVHPATESCDSCHESVAQPHPQPGQKTFKLSQEPPELCAACHALPGTTDHAHRPVQEGLCTTCHDPHASNEAKLLIQPEKDTCLGCHDTVINQGMTVLHGPIEAGTCTACHDPHGSGRPKLLLAEFPTDAYVPYTDNEFELCFTCHDRDLVGQAATSSATNFRDGERNLHYVHVNRPRKGRSCTLCHGIHGARNPVLIADSVPFGTWDLPLRFVKTETGGGCAPGCHKPRPYDRQAPGKK